MVRKFHVGLKGFRHGGVSPAGTRASCTLRERDAPATAGETPALHPFAIEDERLL